MLIQKLRLQHGWSQQQLADFSGLSVRTIQRIEQGKPACPETLKSVASVFNIDFSMKNTKEHPMPFSAEEKREQEAFSYVRKLRGFYFHAAQYVIINTLLVVVNVIVSPHRIWFLWVVLGWGLGLISHAFRVFSRHQFFGAEWEIRQVERRLGRKL